MLQEVKIDGDCILFWNWSIGPLGINLSLSNKKAEQPAFFVGRGINNLRVTQIALRNLVKLNFHVD